MKKTSILATLLAALCIVAFILLLVFMSLSWNDLMTASYPNTATIGPNDTTTLLACYSSDKVKHAKVTQTENDTDIRVYSIQQSEISHAINNQPLPDVFVGRFIANFNNTVHLNYNGNSVPLYTADDGGYINYIITAEIDQPQSCAIELIQFTDPKEYSKLFTGDSFTSFNQTCLNMVETKQSFAIKFSLPAQKSSYFGAKIVVGVMMNVSATGMISSYNTSKLHLQDECLSQDSCTVPISDKAIPNRAEEICVLVNTDTPNVVVMIDATKVKANSETFGYTLAVGVVFSVIVIIVVVLLIALCVCLYQKNKTKFSTSEHATHSTPSLKPDETTQLTPTHKSNEASEPIYQTDNIQNSEQQRAANDDLVVPKNPIVKDDAVPPEPNDCQQKYDVLAPSELNDSQQKEDVLVPSVLNDYCNNNNSTPSNSSETEPLLKKIN